MDSRLTLPQLVELIARQLPPGSTLVVPAASSDSRRTRDALRTLSSRECQVLEFVANGQSNKDIARRLRLSPHTVKRHVANILNKLDAQSRTEAAALWRAAGAGSWNDA
jgi:LuxR family maltose regulon positive regulatory protein